jgi:hypothetical protein
MEITEDEECKNSKERWKSYDSSVKRLRMKMRMWR